MSEPPAEVMPSDAAGDVSERARRVQQAVKTWTGELIDLGGRNTLLYYRDLKQGTLDLGPGSTANEAAVDDLLSTRPSRLSLFFDDSTIAAAARRARTIKAKSDGKLDDDWALAALERSVEISGAPTLGHLVAERLVQVAAGEPVAAVRILARMLERPESEWDYIGWRDEAKSIVESALASTEPDAADYSRAIVDFYVRRGELDFRDLLRPSDS